MVEELSKYLVKLGDYEDLAKKMDLAIEHYPSIKESYYEKFNPKKIITRYKALKHEL